jgi:class 3 adenylate cyclase
MGAEPIPGQVVAHVIAEVPLDVATLGGTMYVDTTSTTQTLAGMRRRHACSPSGKSFTVTPPPDWTAASRPVRVVSPSKGTATDRLQPPAVRLCFAVDIERFSRFTTAEGVRAQHRFAELLATARAHAGLDETTVLVQESGDGQFVVLPPGLDESVVLPRLVEGLRLALRETNADLNEHARLRLRVAFHRGHVSPAANGWTGDAVIAVRRLLDSDVLRESLVDVPDADAAFIVPEVLYHDIVAHRHGTLDPDEFDRVEVTVPTKGFSAPAWVHSPL